MGLTAESTGHSANVSDLLFQKAKGDKVIALAGNPNVGKSTVFNVLTGMNQHTGNWPGKTVANAHGRCIHDENTIVVDLPGTYSLLAHSVEEEIARDFICFGETDAVVVVCDATCLERNLNLVLQTIEITRNVIVCVNLIDEAEKKCIHIDFAALEQALGVPVIATDARRRRGIDDLMCRLHVMKTPMPQLLVQYSPIIEQAIALVEPALALELHHKLNPRWTAIRLLDKDESLNNAMSAYIGYDVTSIPAVRAAIDNAQELLASYGLTDEKLRDEIVSCIVKKAEQVGHDTVAFEKSDYHARDRAIDKVLTSKWTGIPIMLLLLCVIFYITLVGSNIPSALLSDGLFYVQDRLTDLFLWLNAPQWLHGALVLGVFRVLAWVVSVMLPPMAIFFPLFTLLEDLGYLPRVAFNLDKYFKRACACGKQALTMCMGFGCNAVGVVGCRIIDSPRERLIAIITNNFVPCNGRFPTLIAIIAMFFVSGSGPFQAALSTLLLTSVIVLGVCMTFAVSRLLSKTILKGVPSSFTLELPPYRKPQIGKVILRSMLDRTLFVLSRAAAIAAPAGLLIWIMANVTIADMSLLRICTQFLDPFARAFGLDGVILFAFILGFPANEIVVPIIIMAYLSSGSILTLNISALRELLISNGWTWLTAVCTMLFSLLHWPCSTTCLTIKKETQSLKWTAVSFAVPTTIGLLVCFVVASMSRLLGLA